MKTVDFFGETFALTDEIPEFALMEFAEAADSGGTVEGMDGMAAMLRLVIAIVDPADEKRFRATARKNRAGGQDLLEVIKAAFEAATERPTGRPADSSDGPSVIEPRSVVSSDARVSERLAGRPDLQLAVSRARTA